MERGRATGAPVRDWEALGQIAQALVEERSLERIGAVVVEQSERVFHSSLFALWIYEPAARELRLLAQRGYSPESAAELRTLSLEATSPTALAARIGESIEVRNMHAAGPEYAFARRIADREGLRSVLAVPLLARGHLVGALTFVPGRKSVPHRFSRRERGLIRAFADLCAAAIENARLYAEAQEAIRLRGEFISVAAHELRTPVTSLKGFAQLVIRDLARGALTPERIHGALETIDRQADRLTLLVSRLLDVARLESGRLEIEPRPTDLRALVGGIVEAAQRHAPDHQLSVVAPGPVEAEVDALRIEQVVSNLVDNAIKYSPSGGAVVVEIAAIGLDLRLAVRDQGIGIPPERRRQIFERFYQAHVERNLGGMGLGLYVSNEIVRLHGGRIEAEFPESGGTCFVVTLPRGRPAAAVGE